VDRRACVKASESAQPACTPRRRAGLPGGYNPAMNALRLYPGTVAALLAVCIIASWQTVAEESQAAVPELLRPLVPMVEACAAYHRLAQPVKWEEELKVAFDKSEEREHWEAQLEAVQESATLVEVDGRRVVQFVSLGDAQSLVRLGKPVAGIVAIEVEARTSEGAPCDLSIVLDGIGKGPAFQFGGYRNTRTLIWTGPTDDDGTYEMHDIPGGPAIEAGRWHRVRVELVERRMTCYVDGRRIAEVHLPERFDPAVKRQPMFYHYDSKVQIAGFRIERGKASDVASQDKRFKQAFGDRFTEATLTAGIAKLIEALDHDEWAVREHAESMLRQVGDLARPQLLEAGKEGPYEQRFRAQRVLDSMRIVTVADEAPSSSPDKE
jgi:uncharacterized protein (UPF0218 family)